MYTLLSSASFDSAHFLKGYNGKCSNIHGHRWKVEITVASNQLEKEGQTRGMVVDFGTLKEDINAIVDELDHCLIIETGSLKEKTLEALDDEGFKVVCMDFRPTAENFAKFFYEEMEERGYNVLLSKVFETPKNCAGYSKGADDE